MKSVYLLCLIAATLSLAGCGRKNPAALAEAGLLGYEFTMVQGDRPQSGKPLVIEFWASWCGPCVKLFPHLNKLYGELEETGIQFVALTREPIHHVSEYIRSQELLYPVGVDTEAQYGKALDVTHIPYAVIVDAEGNVVWSGHSGRLSMERIEKSLARKSPKSSAALRHIGTGADFVGFPTLQGVDPASPANLHETRTSTRFPFARYEFCEACGQAPKI